MTARRWPESHTCVPAERSRQRPAELASSFLLSVQADFLCATIIQAVYSTKLAITSIVLLSLPMGYLRSVIDYNPTLVAERLDMVPAITVPCPNAICCSRPILGNPVAPLREAQKLDQSTRWGRAWQDLSRCSHRATA
jgi:hypothetical protein